VIQPPRRPAGQWTPAELGVHQVIAGGPVPAYIRRPHDEQLRAVLDPATEDSRWVVIRGEALSGKSRAAYEAVTDLLADWPLEYLPTAAALAARLEAGIPPPAVVWLGELRHHADADGGAAVLDRLDDLLEDDGYLVIATIWPGYWDSYTAAAAAGLGAGEPAAVVGRLLAPLDKLAEYNPADHDPAYGGFVDVPPRFTPAEVSAAADAGDPVLAAAAAAAGPDGEVTQYLAGARDLLARYDAPGADSYGWAVITAAMDATRLGHASPLPATLLRDAAAGYTTSRSGSWDAVFGSGWALQPVTTAAGTGTAGYRVVDYLDQHGRRTRGDQLGPASLWDALAAHAAGASDLGRLAQAARDRGLYRHAATLWTKAAASGRADAAIKLITHLGALAEPAETAHAARWAVGQVSLDDPWYVAGLVRALSAAGAAHALPALLEHDPVGQVSLGRRWDVAELVRALRAAGAAGPARTLAVRAAGQASLDDPRYVAWLLRALREAGATEALHDLASTAARDSSPEDMRDVARLLEGLNEVGAADEIRALAERAVGQVSVEDPHDVAELLNTLRAVGADDAVRALLARNPASHASLDPTGCVAELLEALHAAGAADAVRTLADRAAAQASLEYADYAARLLNTLRVAGAAGAIQTLLARDPAGHANLVLPEDVPQLFDALHAAGAGAAVQTLAARVAEQGFYYLRHVPELTRALRTAGATDVLRALSSQAAAEVRIDDPEDVASQLEELRDAGSADAIQILLDRDPARQVSLDDPWEIARLLGVLRAAGAVDQVRTLADRAAHGVSPDDPGAVARLLEALRAVGAVDEIRTLADRAADGASLHDPQGIARLLEELCRTGTELRRSRAGDAVQTLLARDPGRQVAIDASQPFRPGHQRAVARLLAALSEAGAAEAARALAVRAADAGMFALFLKVRPDEAVAYRFGREPDGTPSPPWSWSEPVGP
jgi:DNA-binding transcriptional ArsR family regulator